MHAGAMELRSSLCSLFDLELPGTAAFDFPTTNALTRIIVQTKQELENAGLLVQGPGQKIRNAHGHRGTHSLLNVSAVINTLVQRMLGGTEPMDEDKPLMDAGLDSLSKSLDVPAAAKSRISALGAMCIIHVK